MFDTPSGHVLHAHTQYEADASTRQPKICVLSPFPGFFAGKAELPIASGKKPPQRRTGGQNCPPPRRRARPLCARWLVRSPVRLALRPSGRGAGRFCAAPFWFAVSPRPRPAPRARRFRLRRDGTKPWVRTRGALRSWQGVACSNNRALSAARPAAPRPASPPFRRPLAWSRGLWGAWWGAVAPAPAGRLSALVGLVGLAAGRALSCVRATGWRVAFAPFRRGRAVAALRRRFRGVWFCVGRSGAFCGRAPRGFFPPDNSLSLPLWRWRCPAMRKISIR